MIQVLEGNPNSSYGIKNLLKKVDILSISSGAAYFVVELGFLPDQVSADLLRKQEASTKIERKKETQATKWDAAIESTTKVEILEKSFSQNQEEFDTCTTNISTWEEQIKELQAKIRKAKDRQDESQQLDRQKLDKEIIVGIYHVERAQQLGTEIDTLTLALSWTSNVIL